MPDVLIPSKAVSAGTDLQGPARAILEDLNLLGNLNDTKKAGEPAAAFQGPPQSVALIEAGATAAAKGWATGIGATILATWGAVLKWFGSQQDSVQVATLIGAAVVTAAAVLAIGYLMASDVRGRAAAAVATIEARSAISQTMVNAAEAAYQPADATSDVQLVPLASRVMAKNIEEQGGNEDGWLVVAMLRDAAGKLSYVVVKGAKEATLAADKLRFVTTTE